MLLVVDRQARNWLELLKHKDALPITYIPKECIFTYHEYLTFVSKYAVV